MEEPLENPTQDSGTKRSEQHSTSICIYRQWMYSCVCKTHVHCPWHIMKVACFISHLFKCYPSNTHLQCWLISKTYHTTSGNLKFRLLGNFQFSWNFAKSGRKKRDRETEIWDCLFPAKLAVHPAGGRRRPSSGTSSEFSSPVSSSSSSSVVRTYPSSTHFLQNFSSFPCKFSF